MSSNESMATKSPKDISQKESSPLGSTAAHSRLVNDVVLAIGALPGVIAWKNATGVARALSNPKQVIRYGLVGSSDVIALLTKGRIVFLECKTGDATLSSDQKNFKQRVEELGHIYLVVRDSLAAKDFILQKLDEAL